MMMIILPMIEVFQVWWTCRQFGLEMYQPMYATFQSLPGIAFHIIHRIYSWFMPLYLIIIFSEPVIEDAETHIVNCLMCREGRDAYVRNLLRNSFVGGFSLIMLAMLINLVLCCIVFRDGTHMDMDPEDFPENTLYVLSHAHPLAANLIFAAITAFVSALIGTVGTAVALAVPDRKIVYGFSLLMWFVPLASKKSLMLVFQPFSEYGFGDLIPIFAVVTISYIIVIAVAVFWRNRYGTI
ncbi:hypothetical protein ACQQ9V_00200 [Hornefia butyriciproducens]|uniref:hypothetical protein n=1 Tax=Hornefia butyriciproducens TaxID=2652293 RepID=UPI003CFD8377